MKCPKFFSTYVVSVLGAGTALCAATSSSSTDSDWSSLQTLVNSSGEIPQRTAVESDGAARSAADVSGSLRSIATKAQEFEGNCQDEARLPQAKLIEARALHNIALLGDSSNNARISALSTELRGNSKLPAKDRIGLLQLQEVLQLQRSSIDVYTEKERLARSLISAFPGESAGYNELLNVALNNPDPVEESISAKNPR